LSGRVAAGRGGGGPETGAAARDSRRGGPVRAVRGGPGRRGGRRRRSGGVPREGSRAPRLSLSQGVGFFGGGGDPVSGRGRRGTPRCGRRPPRGGSGAWRTGRRGRAWSAAGRCAPARWRPGRRGRRRTGSGRPGRRG